MFNRERADDNEVFAFTPRARPIPVRLQSYRWARNANKSGIILLGAIAIVLPLFFTTPSTQQLFTEVLAYAICASSLTVLTGWLGQLSLGQMALAGFGALLAARMVYEGVPFWVAIAVTTVVAALLATILGLGALRVRGLYLAVVTFTFALAAEQYFFNLPILSGQSADGSDIPFAPGKLFSLSFRDNARTTTSCWRFWGWFSSSRAGSETAESAERSCRCGTTRMPRPRTPFAQCGRRSALLRSPVLWPVWAVRCSAGPSPTLPSGDRVAPSWSTARWAWWPWW